MDIEKVNAMDFGEFVDVFGNVIERCPLVAAAVWSQRPFSDADDLERQFSAFLDALPVAGKASGPTGGCRECHGSVCRCLSRVASHPYVHLAIFIVRFSVLKLKR